MKNNSLQITEENEVEFYVIRTNGGKHIEILSDSEIPLTAADFITALKEFLKEFDEKPDRIFDCDPPFSGMN